MAKTTARPVALPWTPLSRALTREQRRGLHAHLRGLLAWQLALRAWPRPVSAPRWATPFVSLYECGRLLGCFGSGEGEGGERVARAFLRALHDPRQGGTMLVDRAAISAELTYLTDARALRSLDDLEVGTHGLAWVAPDVERSALLLPQVARDHGYGAEQLLDALCAKASVTRAALGDGRLYRLSAESIVEHAERVTTRGPRNELAAQWLAAQIGTDGTINFAVDPRSAARTTRGLMHHGRAAVVVEALAAFPQHRRRRALAARWLASEIDAGLRGRAPPAWPDDEGQVLGTLALAVRAGLPFDEALRARASSSVSAWHSAQVVTALGPTAPSALWNRCVADLDQRPWAPWTALAAVALGDHATYERTSRALIGRLMTKSGVPELAATAITIEALAAGPTNGKRSTAIAHGRAFLRRWQFVPGQIPAALDPAAALGAFPLSPVASGLRCDVTAHALLALA